ncbi:MAG TPA: aminopeptidase P family protein [Clostridiaceae bacterium]|nr:aminopeptidase P family protein [Clostridiaceae bacterium]
MVESRKYIPKEEYLQRIKNLQKRMRAEDIDILLTHACECESANVRYLSGFWAVFDFAGVLVPREGNAILLTGGPESYDFAVQFANIDDIRIHPMYVETCAPEWDKPTNPYDFKQILDEFRKNFPIKKIAVANSNIIPHIIFEDLKKGAGDAEIILRDDIIIKERTFKSPKEIELLREAYRITEEALKQTVEYMKPGMREWELEAKWRSVAYTMGAEGTSYPIWVTSGDKTYQSLCRSTDRVIGNNEVVQLTFGAKYNGYCGNMCRPVIIGKIPQEQERMISVCLECLNETLELIKPGVSFAEVYDKFQARLEKNGFFGTNLYGPAHSTGLQECEEPWVDNRGDLVFKPNMVFNVDIWLSDGKYGVRYEDGIVVTENGIDILTNYAREIIRL